MNNSEWISVRLLIILLFDMYYEFIINKMCKLQISMSPKNWWITHSLIAKIILHYSFLKILFCLWFCSKGSDVSVIEWKHIFIYLVSMLFSVFILEKYEYEILISKFYTCNIYNFTGRWLHTGFWYQLRFRTIKFIYFCDTA